MCPLLLSNRWLWGRLRDRLTAMPQDRIIADAYRAHVEAGDWGCVTLLELVGRVQQAYPEMSQSAAITRAMAIIKRVREADGVG
jgi:hypothetical protein